MPGSLEKQKAQRELEFWFDFASATEMSHAGSCRAP